MQGKQWTIADEISRETLMRPTRQSAMATMLMLMLEHGYSAELSCDDAAMRITVRRAGTTRKRGR